MAHQNLTGMATTGLKPRRRRISTPFAFGFAAGIGLSVSLMPPPAAHDVPSLSPTFDSDQIEPRAHPTAEREANAPRPLASDSKA